MRFSSGILAASFLAGFATAAMAADTDGWYLGAETGLNIVQKEKFSDSATGTWSDKNNPGFGILGQVGYATGPFRVEGEVGFRSNDLHSIMSPAGSYSATGNIEPINVSLNGYYDFNTQSAWTPYVGVGVGGANLNANNLGYNGKIYLNDQDFVVAYQGIAGLSYAVDNNLSIKADYRYFRAQDAHLSDSATVGTTTTNYAAHSILVGFTYKFGGSPKPVEQASAPLPPPPPPAPPAPPPAPVAKPVQVAPIAKNFQVFFDFDKSGITMDAQKIIEQAASTAKTSKTAAIELIGHTDSSGSDAYNQKLSLRRAEAVKAALVKLGVPANEISVVGKGKGDQLVPTKDGVKEPQNRRVQILLQ